jgi:methylmalonyl-CoA epimerase
MTARLDHIGVAVADLAAALAFYRDALGLHVEGVEDVATQRVRAHFVPAGDVALELLEGTSPDSPIAKFVDRRGPGLHHITFRVDDIASALDRLRARGIRLIDERPRPGAEGALVAFVHPSAAHGVLVELKQAAGTSRVTAAPDSAMPSGPTPPVWTTPDARALRVSRFTLGDFEIVSLYDGYMRLDGGSMFGVVPKTMWSTKVASDERNRIAMALRPLLVRGVGGTRTLLIDAGVGDKESEKFADIYGLDRSKHLDHALAEVGLSVDDIDIVVATHLHFDHAGGFTTRDPSGRLVPRFPRARYVVRRGDWEDATHANEGNRASYRTDNFLPLAESGVLTLLDDDQTIVPGVRVQRTPGHTAHHQSVWIESGGRHAAFVGDLVPMAAHVPEPWIMGFDLQPMETLATKKAFYVSAQERDALLFFEHDPVIVAARLRGPVGNRMVEREDS